MTNNFELLREWAINYIKNKDIIHKNIKNIEKDNHGFLVEYKDKKHYFIIKPDIYDINNLKEEFITLVLFNTRKNLEFILNKWKELIRYDKLSIYFVNLNSNEKWVLHPFTHNKVCSNKKLKNGLITLFGSVGEYKGSTDKA